MIWEAEVAAQIERAKAELVIDADQHVVPARAVQNALHLMGALPICCPTPAVGIEPDGAISLDWAIAPDTVISLSISESEQVPFAWLRGSNHACGVGKIDGTGLPDPLLRAV